MPSQIERRTTAKWHHVWHGGECLGSHDCQHVIRLETRHLSSPRNKLKTPGNLGSIGNIDSAPKEDSVIRDGVDALPFSAAGPAAVCQLTVRTPPL